uniref:Paraneoplastic antigen Ma-like N-terminal domain-containing protein n=1 Tax=Erpetoichthys calabaricus TaxID=27687 RepID=A0A8C4S342_ERPCA
MAEKTELVSELKKWCRGEGLSEAHGLLVIVPEDVEIAHIEEILGTIKCLGRVRVRGRIFNMELNSLMVLCECKNEKGDHLFSTTYQLTCCFFTSRLCTSLFFILPDCLSSFIC